MDLKKYLPAGARDFVDRHPKFNLALKSFSYLFSERIIKILVGFFVHAWLARHLGPDHFGKLSYVVKTVNIFYVFGLFGVDELIIKYFMEGKYSEKDILKTVLLLRFKMGLIGLLCLGVFLVVFQPEGLIFTIITFLYGINIFFQAFNVFDLTFHSKMNFQPLFWANNISYLTSSALRVLGILINAGITFFLGTYLVGEVILKSLVLRKIKLKEAFSGTNRPELSKVLTKGSIPFFLSSFVVLLDQRMSFLFIEKYLSLTDLGNYSVAVTLVDLWLFLPTAVASAVFPTIVTAQTNNPVKYQLRIQYLSDVLIWLAMAFSVGVFITSDYVIHILYGSRYVDAPVALRMFAFTTIPVFFNLGRIKWMTLENKLNEWLWINACCLILNLAGHLTFVPKYGIEGAIGSFLASQVIGNLLMSLFFESSRKSILMFFKTLTFPVRLAKKIR